jgi:hypothetical protein
MKDKDFEVGDEVEIKFDSKEYYIKNPQSLKLNFYNLDDEKIAFKENRPNKLRKILRAHFNNYGITAKISSVKDLDETTLKYYKHIPGLIVIKYHKNA